MFGVEAVSRKELIDETPSNLCAVARPQSPHPPLQAAAPILRSGSERRYHIEVIPTTPESTHVGDKTPNDQLHQSDSPVVSIALTMLT